MLLKKTDFITSNMTRNKEGHLTMTEFRPQKDITIINVYVPSSRLPKYTKQKLTEFKGRIGNSTTIVGDFNTYHQ